MANEPIVTPTPVEAPVVAPVVAEAVAVPVTAPVVEATTAPVAVETPAVEAPKPPVTVIAQEIDKQPKPVIAPVEGEKPPVVAETKAVEKTTEGGQSEEPAPPPKYDPFTLPEGITLDDERVGKFTEILADLETKSKADHALVQEFGQKAVDFHLNEVKSATETLTKFYQDSWDKQKTDWKDTFLADPEIGGNQFQTTVDRALNFIRTHGGTAEQQTEFRNLMETSGLGNHPAMIRLLANAGKAMSEGRPLAAAQPASQPKSKVTTMYGKQS